MAELITIPAPELAELKARLIRLGREKAQLQLIAVLMNRLSELPGLEKTVEGMLQFVMDILGGMNVTIFFRLDEAIHCVDVHGRKEVVSEIQDDLVRQVFETREFVSRERDFSQTGMRTKEFTKATTWVMPLLVGADLVGVLRMDDLLVAGHELQNEVQTFLRYASLVLKNEISGETRLRRAFDEVSRANRALKDEVAVRRRAEEELQRAKDDLERRVAGRTAELSAANERLRLELVERARTEGALAAQHSTLRGIIEGTTSPIFSLDRQYRYVAYNRSHASVMQALYGTEIEAGRSMLDNMTVTGDREKARENLDRALAGEHLVESAYSGDEQRTRRYFEVSHHPVRADDGHVIGAAVFANDVTDRRRAEESLQRLNRELRAISNCNQTLMRAQDEPSLLNDICRIVCNEAGYRMAWVGYAESDDARTIRPVAWAGAEDGYLEQAGVTWADTERGRGPAGTAIRSGKSACIQDFTTDPLAAPWRDRALERGYRSSIALPLKDEGENTFGVLNIYSSEPNAFTGDEMRLLEELSGDLAFGITVLRTRTERRLVEEERLAYLRFFESMDRVNRAMQGTNNLEQMLSDVLDAVLAILDCDRAFLMYPCDPDAATWSVPMERHRPEYPGAQVRKLGIPMDPDVARTLRELLASDRPVKFGPEGNHPLPEDIAQQFNFRSFMSIACYPKVDKPWQFGIHQCSYARVWTQEEERLLREIGRRLADALTSLLAHRDLQESETKYRRIVDTASEGIWMLGPDTMTSFVNARMAEMLGHSSEEMNSRPMTDFMFEEDAPDHLRKMENRRQGLSENYERRFRCRDGRTVWTLACVAPIFDDEHQFKGSLAMFTDITERKRAEGALLESHNFLNAVVEGTSDAVFVKDLQGRYLMINSAGARFLGKSVEDVTGRDDGELFTPETVPAITDSDRQVMATGGSQMFEETATAAGVTRTYLSMKSVYRDAQGKAIGLIGISRDVTELKRLEEQFRQAQKMEAVGRLAGGVAHDFNNLLTVINGYSELIFSQLCEGDPNREPLAEIRSAGERAANLTRQLLAFSRKQVLQPRVLNLNSLLGELQKLLQRLIGEDIELVVLAGSGQGLVKVDPGQFEQAIINLAVNARDAMPHGGRLTIETRDAELDADYAGYRPEVRPGRYVLVGVSDSGQGMDHATKARIFEPFFTTKEPGKGTGLGLAMVYGFVKQSGGHIEVYSEVGHGTTFKVYLPRAEETIPSSISFREHPTIPMGAKTVLLVEDEDAVRTLARIILESSGYTVLVARGGQEAIQASQQHQGPIHLLVTDLVMPGMSGRELAERLMKARPGLRILLMSGYTAEATLIHALGEPRFAFLQKPFNPSDLARRVGEVLEV